MGIVVFKNFFVFCQKIMDNVPDGLNPEAFNLLKKKYLASLPLRIKEIREAIDSLEKEFNEKNLNQLGFLIHKMAGSAGTFGFPQVTSACRELENKIKERIKRKAEGGPETFILEVKELYRFLENQFNQ